MKYLVDALAAEKKSGLEIKQAYAFAPCKSGKEETVTKEWKAKGIIPIPYNDTKKHSLLHHTLEKWANEKLEGLAAKKKELFAHSDDKIRHAWTQKASQDSAEQSQNQKAQRLAHSAPWALKRH